MMWSWQPSFCVESAHCAKALSPWSPLCALHEMMKLGIVTQQLIRMTITPYPWRLASSPDCSSSLTFEDGLTSVTRSLSPVITPKARSPAMAHSAPQLEPCGLPPSLRSLHQAQLIPGLWHTQGSQTRRDVVKLHCRAREYFRRHTDCTAFPQPLELLWLLLGHILILISRSAPRGRKNQSCPFQEQRRVWKDEHSHFKHRIPIKYFPPPLLLV